MSGSRHVTDTNITLYLPRGDETVVACSTTEGFICP